MPTVAIVEGVKIQFYPDEHPPPHFHAKIAELVAQIRIDPVVLVNGSLPPNKHRGVIDWANSHPNELMDAWNAMRSGGKPRKIK